MTIAEFSIRRPVLVTGVFLLILISGLFAYLRLPRELYPEMRFPVVNVTIAFPGAAPEEVEAQISKPVENAVYAVSGIRTIRSTSLSGAAVITVVFNLDSDLRDARQNVSEAVARIRAELPSGIGEPEIGTIDPSDVAALSLAVRNPSDDSRPALSEPALYEWVVREVRPRLQQLPNVSAVLLQGERKREVQVDVDLRELQDRQMTLGEVVSRLGAAGKDLPIGKLTQATRDTVVRWISRFDSLEDLRNVTIRFTGNEVPIRLAQLASITEGLSEERQRVYLNGKKSLTLQVYRKSGGDALALSRQLRDEINKINSAPDAKRLNLSFDVVHDGTRPIQDGVKEATLAIIIGVLLTVIVVFAFLGSIRSTVITGMALPNSIFGAFLLMWVAGFTVNITTLAALSLAIGLLIDDAIVVRESIFRRIQAGEPAAQAAVRGTGDVALAVVATTLAVVSVFGPVAFLRGIIGRFFREFGLTICFAMLVSLLDSLTMAPMLSKYFAGPRGEPRTSQRVGERVQLGIERIYLGSLRVAANRPLLVLGAATGIFLLSLLPFARMPKSFVPPSSSGEFQIQLNAAPGSSLEKTDVLARFVEQTVRQIREVENTLLTVGGEHGETDRARLLIALKPEGQRERSTEELKQNIRQQISSVSNMTGSVQDIFDIGGGAGQPFVLNVTGDDLEKVRQVSSAVLRELRASGDLTELESSDREGASELRLRLQPEKALALGLSPLEAGSELRLFLSGAAPAQLHRGEEQYDIRVRLRPEQRDLRADLDRLLIPNLNHRLVPLRQAVEVSEVVGSNAIFREDRKRFISISGEVSPSGKGLAHALQLTRDLFATGRVGAPEGVAFDFAGQTRDFQDLLSSMIVAVGSSSCFMYLVLASLYESFIIPLTIMLVLPLAICGAFYALWITQLPLEINSMIGCILLLGVATKNSILLVDQILQERGAGSDPRSAVLAAGKSRLRPILMTSFALIAGMLPVAIPFEEAAVQRSGMAIAVIGGIISSTLLSLFVVPVAYGYLERLEEWVKAKVFGHPRPRKTE